MRRAPRWMGSSVAVLFLVAVTVSCAAGGAGNTARPDRTTTSTTTPAPSTTTTTVPDTSEVPRPGNVADEAFRWYLHPAGDSHVLVGVKLAAGPGPHPAVLLVHASGGLNTDYVAFAEELVDRGFDVAVGCWFATVDVPDPDHIEIPCEDGPPFKGVVDAAVPDLDALVEATRDTLGTSTPITVVGFSRGAGIAALRASSGRPEPVVLVSGMYEGWNAIGSTVPGGGSEVDVVQRVAGGGWSAPTLILHGTADGAIPVQQAYDLEAALRAAGVDVDAHYYEGAGHNLAGTPEIHADLLDRITGFVCAHTACSGA
jgi:dienelactone hydrolase